MAMVQAVSLHICGCCLALALAGCAGEVSFDSPDSASRLRAIEQAAREDDRESIPKLIEMLESDDPAVRILSIRTLERMTGQTLGYDAVAPSYERTPAVDRWEAWYRATPAGAGEAGGKGEQEPDRRASMIDGPQRSGDSDPSGGTGRMKDACAPVRGSRTDRACATPGSAPGAPA